MIRLVCASANPDKAAEIEALLDGVVELAPWPAALGEVAEDADDLEGNARLKAAAVCAFAGAPAVADDTGLEVDALGGAPGVRTARYAGPGAGYADNVERLLAEMRDVAPARRTARFRTVALVVWPDGAELTAAGAVEGLIAVEPRGRGGFGYDPVFVPAEGDGRTFARDERRGQARHQPPGPGLPGSGRGPARVRTGGFEPPHPEGHWDLNPARLPDSATSAKRGSGYRPPRGGGGGTEASSEGAGNGDHLRGAGTEAAPRCPGTAAGIVAWTAPVA